MLLVLGLLLNQGRGYRAEINRLKEDRDAAQAILKDLRFDHPEIGLELTSLNLKGTYRQAVHEAVSKCNLVSKLLESTTA